ncbi:hypothetical protein CPB86DRAFT_869225 [Serendipita vermifera]|nr:hypothetical protein CPB86DRAFT_869225 [Serendipita vermifera]
MSGDRTSTPLMRTIPDGSSKQPLLEYQGPERSISFPIPLRQSSSYIDPESVNYIQQHSTTFDDFNSDNAGKPGKRRRSLCQRWASITGAICKKWNKAGHRNPVLFRFIYTIIGMIVAGILFAGITVFMRMNGAYESDNILSEQNFTGIAAPGQGPRKDALWSLQGRLQQFDPVTRVLKINWALKVIKNRRHEDIGDNATDSRLIGIFRDQDLVPVDQNYQVISPTSIGSVWDLRIANETALPIAIVGRTQWDSFPTEIDMGQQGTVRRGRRPQYSFPFDLWSGSISFVANSWEYARSINSTTAGGIEIDSAYLIDSIMNWRITVTANNTCVAKRDGMLIWVALGPCGLHLTFKAERTDIVKFTSCAVIIINWSFMTCIFFMTCESIFIHGYDLIMQSQVVAICLAALFALPTIRSILPGTPEFGTLSNMIGIVPNVIIIFICMALVSLSTLRKIAQKKKQGTKKKVKKRHSKRRYNTRHNTKEV